MLPMYMTVRMIQHQLLVFLLDGRKSPLTLGTFTVTKILGWDTSAGVV